MLQAIEKAGWQEPIPHEHLLLSNSLTELIPHYECEESTYIRICILSKMKQILLTQAHSHQHPTDSHLPDEDETQNTLLRISKEIFYEDPFNPNTVFSAFFLRFLRQIGKQALPPKGELQLLYHVVGLVIKYFYNEEHFKFLFNEITEQIENHKERVQCALDFFIEVVSTIEYNYQQCLNEGSDCFGAKINHCKFQRYFTTSHLNSMLAVANFFMKRAVLKDNQIIQDGIFCENFKIKASEDHINSVLELLHKVLCFDFIGEKYSENDEDCLVSNIIIPTKNTKYTNLSQFQKWLKNSDWIRIYQFIYDTCTMVSIKVNIIEILGDMARIHMKFFKNKNCYKVHVENIVYALADILEQSIEKYSKEDLLTISIAFGRNITKLTSPSIVPVFFEINTNIYGGLLEGVKSFLVDHIITEEVFNVNIIYYFFKFLHNLHLRCKFEKNSGPLEFLERVTRQVVRNYQNYFRILLKKLFKFKTKDSFHIRQDYLHLRQMFQSYNVEEIMVYLSPFKFMKPRYTSINTVQELFVLVCAKVTRSLYIFQIFPQNFRQRQFGLQMIEKSIIQTIQWFAYTSYSKSLNQSTREQQQEKVKNAIDTNFQLTMESINQEYEEQIQNEYQYCHILRNICFFILQSLESIPERIFKSLNSQGQVFKLINFFFQICFKADLLEHQNQNCWNDNLKITIEQQLQRCVRILELLYLKEWQYELYAINKAKDQQYPLYRYNSINQLQFHDIGQLKDQMMVIETIQSIDIPFVRKNQIANQCLKQIQLLLAYGVARQEKSNISIYSVIQSTYCLQDCKSFLLLLIRNQALLHLLYVGEPVLSMHFESLLKIVREYQMKSNHIMEINRYLEALAILASIKYEQVQEEMMNRLFLFLHNIAAVYQSPRQSLELNEDFIGCLQKIDQQYLKKKGDLSSQQLHAKIQSIIHEFHRKKPYQN